MSKFVQNAKYGVVALAVGAGSAMAADAVDTASVTSAITSAAAALAVIGAAVAAMKYGTAVWKWITKFAG